MNLKRKDDVFAAKISNNFGIPFNDVIQNALTFYSSGLQLEKEGFKVKGVKEQITRITFKDVK